jgi:hypothetical protein
MPAKTGVAWPEPRLYTLGDPPTISHKEVER